MTKTQGNAIIGMLGILIVLILMLSFGGLTAITTKLGSVAAKFDEPRLSARQAWEYRVVMITGDNEDFRRHLTELGNEGWELASARWALQSGTTTWGYECILRRPT